MRVLLPQFLAIDTSYDFCLLPLTFLRQTLNVIQFLEIRFLSFYNVLHGFHLRLQIHLPLSTLLCIQQADLYGANQLLPCTLALSYAMPLGGFSKRLDGEGKRRLSKSFY